MILIIRFIILQFLLNTIHCCNRNRIFILYQSIIKKSYLTFFIIIIIILIIIIIPFKLWPLSSVHLTSHSISPCISNKWSFKVSRPTKKKPLLNHFMQDTMLFVCNSCEEIDKSNLHYWIEYGDQLSDILYNGDLTLLILFLTFFPWCWCCLLITDAPSLCSISTCFSVCCSG